MGWRTKPPMKRPGMIEPCIPTRASKPPVGPQWIHEIKHDGYRLLARKQDGKRDHADDVDCNCKSMRYFSFGKGVIIGCDFTAGTRGIALERKHVGAEPRWNPRTPRA